MHDVIDLFQHSLNAYEAALCLAAALPTDKDTDSKWVEPPSSPQIQDALDFIAYIDKDIRAMLGDKPEWLSKTDDIGQRATQQLRAGWTGRTQPT